MLHFPSPGFGLWTSVFGPYLSRLLFIVPHSSHNLFEKNPPPFVLPTCVIFPLRLDLVIGFEFGIGLDQLDTLTDKNPVHLSNQHGIDALALIGMADSHQIEIGAVVLAKRLEHGDKPKWPETAPVFL